MKITTSDRSGRQTFRDIHPLHISSPEFDANGFIPPRFTCDGENINPPLDIDDVPSKAQSLVLIVDDADAPIRAWVHWVAWNIPVARHIMEDTPLRDQGVNDFRQNKYGGPCPPYGIHRYYFKVYALDTLLALSPETGKNELEKAMHGHVVAYGELVGKYKRR
jgi:Raf kinase inhibitor-like YbhB/YbcL family protein